MSARARSFTMFAALAFLIAATGKILGWNLALTVLNMGLISAVMALGVNVQWGYAGLFNVGIMGFVALGGVACVLIAIPPFPGAWTAGGPRVIAALGVGLATVSTVALLRYFCQPGALRTALTVIAIIIGLIVYRGVLDPAVSAIEAVSPAIGGYLGGLGLPVLLAWPVGAILAAGAAWVIGKTALGLRADYLAIATMGIAEIIIAAIKNEDWLTRGVKNVVGLPRPVPYEVDLQRDADFVAWATHLGFDPIGASTISVKLLYAGMFLAVLGILIWAAQNALNSPWGRMMHAIRDNEVAAAAMGKNVKARHLQVFIIGSAICGLGGAMMTTLDSQLTPGIYQPLRFTFLIWIMVIVGGSGCNLGSVLGGILIWYLWVVVEPIASWSLAAVSSGLPDGSWLKLHLIESSAHMRSLAMGVFLLTILRFYPKGLLPAR